MAKTYTPVNWEAGTIVKQATVTIDNVEYEVNPAEVEGTTPVTAENLKHMDDAIKELYDEGTTSKDIVIGSEEEATEDTKLLIETDTLASLGTEVVNSLEGNETDRSPSVNAINKLITYSEKEQVIGYWENTDGTKQPLYRKVTNFNSPDTTKKYTRMMILKNAKIKHLYGNCALDEINDYIIPYGEGEYFISFKRNGNYLECIQNGFSSKPCELTIEYIKTTDTAISLANEEVEEDEV